MTMLSLRRHSGGLGLSPRRSRPASGGPGGDTEAPSVPQNLVVTAVSSAQIDLTWAASTDNVAVTGYRIYRDNVLVDTSPTNAYADTGLAPNTEYTYEVSARDAAGNESARSDPDSATTHQVIVTAGLIAEWRFDEGTGQAVVNQVNPGTFDGQLGSTTGEDSNDPDWITEGLSFVKANNDVLTCGTAGISGGAARSVVAVIAPGDAGSGNTEFALGWIGTGANFRRWTVRCASSTDDMRIEVAGAGFTTTALTFDPDVWAFIAATQSGNNLNTVILYKDGETAVPVTTNQVLDTAGNFQFGAGHLAGNAAFKCAYGLVYDRALSAGEIAQNRLALTQALAARGITLP